MSVTNSSPYCSVFWGPIPLTSAKAARVAVVCSSPVGRSHSRSIVWGLGGESWVSLWYKRCLNMKCCDLCRPFVHPLYKEYRSRKWNGLDICIYRRRYTLCRCRMYCALCRYTSHRRYTWCPSMKCFDPCICTCRRRWRQCHYMRCFGHDRCVWHLLTRALCQCRLGQ